MHSGKNGHFNCIGNGRSCNVQSISPRATTLPNVFEVDTELDPAEDVLACNIAAMRVHVAEWRYSWEEAPGLGTGQLRAQGRQGR